MIRLTNGERVQDGEGNLTLDPTLNAAAQAHAEDMARQEYFSHIDRHGGKPWDRAQERGYPKNAAVAENIAQGQANAAEVVRDWMDSPGHRRNVLNPRYNAIGVGVARGADRQLYWVQVFGSVTSDKAAETGK